MKSVHSVKINVGDVFDIVRMANIYIVDSIESTKTIEGKTIVLRLKPTTGDMWVIIEISQ